MPVGGRRQWRQGYAVGCLWLLSTLGSVAAAAAPSSDTAASQAVVLVYHHVADDTPASTSITPADFAAHLDYLAQHNHTVWPLPQLVRTLQQGIAVPPRTVAITFDDAWSSVYTTAHPLLKARGWPYTVFVNTAAVEAGRRNVMSWSELQELAMDGVTIGNHSHQHAHLVARGVGQSEQQWRQWVQIDIGTAQRLIQQHTGVRPELFAYPYGEYTAALGALIRDQALVGFGQHSGAIGPASDFSALPRFPMGGHYTDLTRLATAVNTRPLYVTAHPSGPWVVEAGQALAPALQLHVQPGDFDAAQLACYASGYGRLDITQLATGQFQIASGTPLNVGRTKYNCTAPSRAVSGVYHWWSYLFMRPPADGMWYRG